MDPLERPPPGTGRAASLRVSELQTGSQAAGQSIDDRLPGVTSVLAIRARSTFLRGLVPDEHWLLTRVD
jgi:hypothetical protein